MFKLAVLAFSSAALLSFKSPAWLSVESPVNPYDRDTRGAVLLVHGSFPVGHPSIEEFSGAAEGLVNGTRRSVPLHFDTTSRQDVYALRRQWPSDGTWILRISLKETTAIVTFDRAGNVASAVVPTRPSSGTVLPRPVDAREIDSTLAAAARR
jgi:hypothetical protein